MSKIHVGLVSLLTLSGLNLTLANDAQAQQQGVTRLDAHSLLLTHARMNHSRLHNIRLSAPANSTGSSEPETVWDLTRNHLSLELDHQDARISREMQWLKDNPEHITTVSQRALPYYQYILEQVLSRDMPSEIALIPFIESGYDPFVVSPAAAAGPWQFIPNTASSFGLENNWWYDERRDILASTDAALNYLAYLNNLFAGDWLITFAAYNAGEGNVARAINRNRDAGKPTDYWSLSLPNETMRYVPKLLATAKVIRDADSLGVELEAIPTDPYFTQIDTGGQLALSQAAQLAEIDLDELKRLNPALNHWSTAPEGPYTMLVPVEQAEQLQHALIEMTNPSDNLYLSYTINEGDTLGGIARKFGTSVAVIQKINQLESTQIRAGKTLQVPAERMNIAHQTIRPGSG